MLNSSESMGNAIIAFGYHDQQAPRHWNMRKKLEEDGTRMLECHTVRRGFLRKVVDLTRQCWACRRQADTVLVTFPGHYLVPLAWLLTRWPRKRLVFDAFISLSDTLVSDRGKVSWAHPYAWFLYLVDFVSCHMADEVLVDTQAHREFFLHRFRLSPNRVKVVYLDARTDLFFPRKTEKNPHRFDVLFYGTYIPLQGIEHIVEAAVFLQETHPRIQFTLIGSGQTREQIQTLAKRKGARNISFQERMPFEKLPDRIRSAHLSLGIFGTSAKARRVIPHKVCDAVACGTHVLTADTPAIRERFAKHLLVHLCEAGNPAAIAQAIGTLSTKLQS